MKPAAWYFDFVSPYAYLQSEMLGRFDGRLELTPVPVLFAGLLNHWGTVGPAEVGPKRAWTYRETLLLADRADIPMRYPPGHPFNPLPALRLAIAAGATWDAVHGIFRFIWQEGGDMGDPAAVAEMAGRLGIDDAQARLAEPAVKDRLRTNTEEAVEAGIFGVPTVRVDGENFWGVGATDLVLAYLDDPAILDTEAQRHAANLPAAAERRR